ncbi:uncharacterized protein TNCV_1265141 [Trichonephila clavipes]|nr:uncharacterized protein TNCV_1265141 [Trichonephila clavipes]
MEMALKRLQASTVVSREAKSDGKTQDHGETWIACDTEDCGQSLNDDEIVASVEEESDPVDDETDEDENNNNNESSKGPSNADAFSALETAMEWYEQQSECCPNQLLLKKTRVLAAKKRRCTMVQRKISDFSFTIKCNAQQLFRVRPKVMGNPKGRDIW